MKYTIFVNKNQPSRIATEYHKYLPPEECRTITLWNPLGKKKPSVKEMRDWFDNSQDTFSDSKYLIICDAEWFKALHGPCKPNTLVGYIFPLKNFFITYTPSVDGIFYKPDETRDKIKQSLEAVLAHDSNSYKEPGTEIIDEAYYPSTPIEIHKYLDTLLAYPKLTCDIETYSLKHYDAGIASITFCWDMHKGIAFKVDTSQEIQNLAVRQELTWFFKNYKGTLIFHNISFDVYVLTYQLFMKDFLDIKGMYEGLNTLLRDFDDTMLITYLATNSASGNSLSLKEQAQEFAGNWAQDEIGDVSKIPTADLLKYNLIDGLATWYVYHKHYQKMIDDNQKVIYETLFKPAIKGIIQMQLNGLPLDMDKVLETEKQLEQDKADALQRIMSNHVVVKFTNYLNQQWVQRKNKTLKKKRVTIADAHEEFNPNSNLQLKELFYDMLAFPVIFKTDSGEPSTSADTLKALKNKTTYQAVLDLIDALIDFSDVNKILTAFIPAFKKAYKAPDGWHYLCGNFRLGGTVSGRLSSNSPNLQNLPATGSKYAKTIKKCFSPPPDWLFVGEDFASLEDRISALTTKDKNKLKVYLEHYDGHCLRSYSYFHDQMPDITEQLKEIKKEGKVYKVTHDDGTIEYLNENNPKLKEYQNNI